MIAVRLPLIGLNPLQIGSAFREVVEQITPEPTRLNPLQIGSAFREIYWLGQGINEMS